MKFQVFLGSFLTAFSISAFAGTKVGNGGDVVVCTSGLKVTVETLDVYEARTVRNLPMKLYEDNWLSTNFEELVNRLDVISPIRAERYKDYGYTFISSEISFSQGVELIDIPDSEEIFIPQGCKIRQAVIQNSTGFVDEKRYTVDKDVWDVLLAGNKATLVMHEVMYRDAIAAGHTDSRWVRYFNSLIFSDSLVNWDIQKFASFLKQAQISSSFQHKGYKLRGTLNSSQDEYEIIEAPKEFLAGFKILDGYYSIKAERPIALSAVGNGVFQGFRFPKGFHVTFTADGDVRWIKSEEILGSNGMSVSRVSTKYDVWEKAGLAHLEWDKKANHFWVKNGFIQLAFSNAEVLLDAETNTRWGRNIPFTANITNDELLAATGTKKLAGKMRFVAGCLGLSYRHELCVTDTTPYLYETRGDSFDVEYKGHLLTLLQTPGNGVFSIPSGLIKIKFNRPQLPGVDLNQFTEIAAAKVVRFRENGKPYLLSNDIWWYQNNLARFLLKDGTAVVLKADKNYVIELDNEGYITVIYPQ